MEVTCVEVFQQRVLTILRPKYGKTTAMGTDNTFILHYILLPMSKNEKLVVIWHVGNLTVSR
jgi:hypothetical protein